MKPIEQSCDSQRIDDYLDERLSESVALEFEQHLSTCDHCRQQLHERSAEPEMWRDAVALLGTTHGETNSDPADRTRAGIRGRHALGVLDSLTPTDDPEMLGRVGDYEISGVVGVGGMGAVLKGFDKSLRRVVAIKVMAPHLADSGSARTRFQREARAAAAITHDNVIDTYGVSEANGLPYLVMPFARGPSLQKRIDESGPLTVLEVVRIGRQIASGLAAAHEQGLVHRDIKPANILLNEGIERLWITDFGVARAVDDASMTQTGVIAGTPQYMSPEQARGESVDQRSDLFSMGSVLYTACTGRPPFRSEAAYGILRRITDTDPRPIREINPEVPDWLCQIIERLMAKHPADRYQNASEVEELLEDCLAHLQQPMQVDLPACVAASADSVARPPMPAVVRGQTVPLTAAPSMRWLRNGLWGTLGLLVMMGMGLAALQVTEPAEIAGRWTGEQWESVSLSTVEEASGWYTGSFVDAEGRRGALQLEWSRLQRRYNGRWKIGADQSGSVTLRASGNELRGAVSIDPESRVGQDTPRLREFSWQHTGDAVAEVGNAQRGKVFTGKPMVIQSPVKGRVVRWGDSIDENATVEKGEFIAEIADLDPSYFQRLEKQVSASKSQVEAARALVQASQRNLESLKTTASAFEAQRKAYTQVKEQVVAAAKTFVDSARNKVDAEKAQLAEHQAVLEQMNADYERQKQLFEQKIVSEVKFQLSERKLKESEAKVQRAEAVIQAAENEVIAKQRDEKAKEQKAQADLDYATAQLNKAQGDVVKGESELAKAQVELQRAEKELLEMETKVARQTSQLIQAPFSGVVTQLTRNTVLKEGDTICLIWPEPAEAKSKPDSRAVEPANETVVPKRDSVSGLSGTSAWRITETLGAASALARRFRVTQSKLRAAAGNSATAETIAELEKDLAAAEFERETAVAILNAQLDAEKTLNKLQVALRDRVRMRVESGDLDPPSLSPTEQAVVMTAAEIQQLGLLIRFYASLGRKEGTTPADDQSVAVAILKVRLDAAKKRLSYQSSHSQLTRSRFEAGHGEVDDLLKAEQAEATVAAEVRKYEALLKYYEQGGIGDAEAEDKK